MISTTSLSTKTATNHSEIIQQKSIQLADYIEMLNEHRQTEDIICFALFRVKTLSLLI